MVERHPLRVAFEARDFGGFAETLAPDVALHSPITGRFEFSGRDEVARLLAHVRAVLEDVHYIDEFEGGDTHVLRFGARVGGQEIEGVDLLRLDEQGRVAEMTVFVRPLPGLTALMAALAPLIGRERGRVSGIAAAGVRPIAALTRVTDRIGARMVGNR